MEICKLDYCGIMDVHIVILKTVEIHIDLSITLKLCVNMSSFEVEHEYDGKGI